jgi:aryl-alcohol dehydrogenase-like predicted oxidoreductase
MAYKGELGRSGIMVSTLGMGCWVIGGPLWKDGSSLSWAEVDDRESIRALHCALDLGVTFFHTADVYGAGHRERVLGQAFAGHRDEVIITTKFNSTFDEATRQVTGWDASPRHIRKACEASLRRLQTDYIDPYQFHNNDYPAEQAGEVLDTLEALFIDGKIRTYGWSTDCADRAQFFAQGENCSAIQLQLNVLEDNQVVKNICEIYDLAAITRGPLAMGLLTGKYRPHTKPSGEDIRGDKNPDWLVYFKDGAPNPDWLKRVESIREILKSGGRTLAQGALAWLGARSEKTLPIPGFRTDSRFEENCGAMQFGPLTNKQMQEIDALIGR